VPNGTSKAWYHILRQTDPPTPHLWTFPARKTGKENPARKNPDLEARVFDGALTGG
jgi:hypothetical protein